MHIDIGTLTPVEACLVRDSLAMRLRMCGLHHPDAPGLQALLDRVTMAQMSAAGDAALDAVPPPPHPSSFESSLGVLSDPDAPWSAYQDESVTVRIVE